MGIYLSTSKKKMIAPISVLEVLGISFIISVGAEWCCYSLLLYLVISIAFPPHFPGRYHLCQEVAIAKTVLDHRELRKNGSGFLTVTSVREFKTL